MDVNKQLLDALKEIREFNLERVWSPKIGELCNKAIAAAEQAQQAESLTWKPGHRPPSVFKTSEAGRQYVADYFAKALRRHDFSSYIKGHLAADFACALSDGLHAMQQAQPPAVAVAVPDGWRNEVVPSKEFDSLFFWLYRCEEKGHLENCPDLVGPMDDYSRAMLSYPAKP